MSIFNSFRQHLYRFYTTKERDEAMSVQPALNSRVFQLMKRFGGKSDSTQPVEFFFYSDEEDKANNLAIELSRMGYEVYGVYQPESGYTQWAVIGCTPPMKLCGKQFDDWTMQMAQKGFESDCKFDGWGTLIE